MMANTSQDDSATQTQPAAAAAASWGRQTGAPLGAAAVPSHLAASSASHHFKYNFLSAGTSSLAERAVSSLRVNRRPGIMDATRSFEDAESAERQAFLATADPQQVQEEKQRKALEAAQRDRAASGLGYGTAHAQHFTYLSKALPARATSESFFSERPEVFPTVALPALPARPNHGLDLDRLPFHEQDAYQKPFKTRIASASGFGPKRQTYFAYQANTYWRKT
jgi:hypothetical protein